MVTALVSGGNRGIGYGIVRRLANDFPSSAVYGSGNEHLTIYLGARDTAKGEEAKTSILSEVSSSARDRVSIEVRQMDVLSSSSISNLAKEFSSGVDILINNSGIAMDGFDGDVAKRTVETNYTAVKNVIKAIPVREGGRIVNVASLSGVLKGYSPEITQRFKSASSESDADQLMQDFQTAVADNTWKEKGWKGAAYATSKAGLIAYTKALAKDYQSQGKNVTVNACCPGYVNTDMTKGKGYKTLDQGAETPVFLAIQEKEGITGEFWSEKKVHPWEVKE
ncbi:NAD(P)-binding protein [Testicularia cyperi]|uniref:NAD(P)-binding protein n=1 Tax=Testicularia cyperi TaxID=1882483 RepID=A0A317XV27_9BASI|nr:NAD(P)-binding protein [Testicularia cyperi]